MKRKQAINIIIMLILSLIFLISLSIKKSTLKTLQVFDIFDTYSEITINAGNDGDKTLQKCSDYLTEKDALWSPTKPDSDVTRLNVAAGKSEVALNPETIDILNKSLKYSAETNGFFDVTVGSLVNLWNIDGENPQVPTKELITDAIHKTGFASLSVDNTKKTAFLSKEGFSVTLGAIAKGYATDGLVELLKKEKITSALINLGGNTYCLGNQPSGKPWTIGIQDPADSSKLIGSLNVFDTAIITSGSYQRYFEQDGIRYHHILNPYTGMPSNSGLLSVSIISHDSTLADVLSTACFVIGYKESIALLREYDAMAIFVTDDKTVYYSSKLQDCFQHDNLGYEYRAF